MLALYLIYYLCIQQKNQDIVMDLIKQNVLENERLRLKFQQHSKKDSECKCIDTSTVALFLEH